MEVVLLVNLPLDLALDAQTDNIWVSLACYSCRVGIDQCERLLKHCDALSCVLLFLFDVVLEVARERLDLLYLLCKICAQAAQLVDHVGLDIASLVSLDNCLLVKVAENAVRIIEAPFGEERRWRIGVVDDVGDLEEALCAVLV